MFYVVSSSTTDAFAVYARIDNSEIGLMADRQVLEETVERSETT
jgi:hypothetical protein